MDCDETGEKTKIIAACKTLVCPCVWSFCEYFFPEGLCIVQQEGRTAVSLGFRVFSELLLLKHSHTFSSSMKFSVLFTLWKRKE